MSEIDQAPTAAHEASTDLDGAKPPRVGVVIGVAFMLLGFAMFAASFTDSQTKDATSKNTNATAVPVEAPGIPVGTTAPMTDAGLGVGFAPERDGRTPLRGFAEARVSITSGAGTVSTLCVLSAVTAEQRTRGLMEVADPALGGYDGMLFEFPGETPGAFWMRNTPTPLSIAYFDGDGNLVSTADMEPCSDDDGCPSYPAQDDFQYALEVPQGMLKKAGAVGAARMRIDDRVCPEVRSGD